MGAYNIGIGDSAVRENISGLDNIGIGNAALVNTTGSFNTGLGQSVLGNNTTGEYNTAVGHQCMDDLVTGSYNTSIGAATFNGGVNMNISNATAIGYGSSPGASNTIRLGNAAITSIGGYANWTNLSDGRFKKDIKHNVVGLDFIMKLRPITYRLDLNALSLFAQTPSNIRMIEAEQLKENEIQTGFIAQEVERAAKEAGFTFHGVETPSNGSNHYGLRYAEFVVPLVKAVQEQQKEIEDLSALVQQLKQRLEALEYQTSN